MYTCPHTLGVLFYTSSIDFNRAVIKVWQEQSIRMSLSWQNDTFSLFSFFKATQKNHVHPLNHHWHCSHDSTYVELLCLLYIDIELRAMVKCFPAWKDIGQPTHSFAATGLFPWEQMQMTKRKAHLAFSLKHSTNTRSIHAYGAYGRGKYRELMCTIPYVPDLSLWGNKQKVLYFGLAFHSHKNRNIYSVHCGIRLVHQEDQVQAGAFLK